jgi:hypothetical protein
VHERATGRYAPDEVKVDEQRAHASKGARLIAIALVISAGVVALVAVAAAVTDRAAGDFTRDIRTLCEAAGSNLPFYSGAMSELNIMVWAAIGALALLTAYLFATQRGWFTLFGLFVLGLAADDAFTLHESGPRRVIPEDAFYVAYAVVALLLLLGVRRRRFDATAIAFLTGGVLLAASVVVDQAFTHEYLWEDGLKLAGAVVWIVVPLLELMQLRVQAQGSIRR